MQSGTAIISMLNASFEGVATMPNTEQPTMATRQFRFSMSEVTIPM